MVRYVVKPEPILIEGLDPFTLDNLIMYLVNTDDKFNNNGVGIRTGMRIEDAIEESNDSSFITLDEAHWKFLKDVIESPSKGYPALYVRGADEKPEKLYFGRRLIPFIDAVSEAKEEKPTPSEAEETEEAKAE